MLQIVDSVTNTCMKFANEYGTWVAAGVVGFVVIAVALPVLARILRRGGPNHGA